MPARRWFQVLLASALFSVGCAESADSPVAPFGKTERESEHLHLKALKFDGRGQLGVGCDFFVAIEEDGHLLVKVEFATTDGHSPLAGEADFFLYDGNNGRYYSPDSNQPNTSLSLSSVLLTDDDLEADRNRLNDYIANNELDQSIRIEFKDGAQESSFVNALALVLEDESQLPALQSQLDQVELIEMVLAHGDHYHSPTCRNYTLSGVEETEFEMEHDHPLPGHPHDHSAE